MTVLFLIAAIVLFGIAAILDFLDETADFPFLMLGLAAFAASFLPIPGETKR